MSVHSNHFIHAIMTDFGGFVSPEWLVSSEDNAEALDRLIAELPVTYFLDMPTQEG